MTFKIILVLSLVNVLSVQSAKILGVFPMPSISHQVVFRKLTQELAKRGHELTVITTDPVYLKGEAPVNYQEIDVRNVSYSKLQKFFQANYKVDQNLPSFSELREGSLLLPSLFEAQLETTEIKELLTKDKDSFNLILIEAVMHPAVAFSHKFNAPTILISSMGAFFNNHDILGSLTHPFLYPSFIHRRIYNLSIYEKIINLYYDLIYKYAVYSNENYENKMLQKHFGSDIPPLSELYENIHMLFINLNPIWADNQPVPPSVVYMGGIHQLPEKELPENLKTYLDSAERDVIYLSFGTNILPQMMPSDKVDIMVKVLSSLPYNVLWKWNDEELHGKSDNINISKWYPQSDLLRHPKVKLFITQAGLQSTDEAISAGVPLVAVPMLGDQWYNAEKYVRHGIGTKVDIKYLTEDEFRSAIETVIKDKRYRENIMELRKLIRDQPESSLDRALWWSEYVIRNKGAKQLRARGSDDFSLATFYLCYGTSTGLSEI
ncbi:unnamed protein product, partial [Brenthis ino]